LNVRFVEVSDLVYREGFKGSPEVGPFLADHLPTQSGEKDDPCHVFEIGVVVWGLSISVHPRWWAPFSFTQYITS
jgi:hypothetical protein